MTCFDEVSMTLDYARYLAAKTTVDDRALNRHVLAELCRLMPAGAPQVLEVGAGLGTMVARLMDWGAVGAGEYILLDVPAVLPGLLRLLVPGGVYWFTINYDGESIFAPGHPHDDQIRQAYHRDMDERFRYGRPAGESRTGRHLFHYLRAAAAPALAAGSSDWVVAAGPDGNYPGDEAYFLRRILNTIQDALRNRQDRVEPADLADWLAERAGQLATGELVYIAHQLDFVGRSPG